MLPLFSSMALEATHLRFANDLKDRLGVNDHERYYFGAIYPDSRYVTKVKRRLTHPDDYMSWNLEDADDFKKGWHTHLLCDKLHGEILKEWLPEMFVGEDPMPKGPIWQRHTALKILRDIDDAQRFDLAATLSLLTTRAMITSNGEDADQISSYVAMIKETYADPSAYGIEHCFHLWQSLGVGDELALRVKGLAEEYNQDVHILATLERVYPELMKRAEPFYA